MGGDRADMLDTRYARRPYKEALSECGILEALAAFDPRVAGTPPLGLDVPGSDIDVLCFAPDAHAFTHAVWRTFSGAPGFTAKQWVGAPRPVVASFEAAGWRIEVYGEATPVEQQCSWRHFDVERRLLDLGGTVFREAVLERRRQGMKTEPAFAAALGLAGDAYLALLDLSGREDEALISALHTGGFAGPAG